ncbi:hypothetical protein C8J57DRAFT_1407249 [Mycena rebaudengoi]|nr:hypothetical protein C8J57DRAFT_1407249 [Mycena rebaudengoi]
MKSKRCNQPFEMEYPLDERSKPISPSELQRHSETHAFVLPRCFHAKPTRSITVDIPMGIHTVHLVCAAEPPTISCGFDVNVTSHLANADGSTGFKKYARIESAFKETFRDLVICKQKAAMEACGPGSSYTEQIQAYTDVYNAAYPVLTMAPSNWEESTLTMLKVIGDDLEVIQATIDHIKKRVGVFKDQMIKPAWGPEPARCGT